MIPDICIYCPVMWTCPGFPQCRLGYASINIFFRWPCRVFAWMETALRVSTCWVRMSMCSADSEERVGIRTCSSRSMNPTVGSGLGCLWSDDRFIQV